VWQPAPGEMNYTSQQSFLLNEGGHQSNCFWTVLSPSNDLFFFKWPFRFICLQMQMYILQAKLCLLIWWLSWTHGWQ
jgi:hypothetical protein